MASGSGRAMIDELRDQLRTARAGGHALGIHGADTWKEAGRPVAGAQAVSLARHRGVVEYVPGDLTLTARAGTPLSEIVAVTAAEAQWLPLDPWGGDAGTIGATVSTATAGPHAYALGLPRDVVLGVEFITGSGDIVRAGGRVVKNVAGFDLTRLVVGAWGTLGIVTEVSVRLRARPDQTRTLAIPVTAERVALNELGVRLRALPFTPLASEFVNESLARAMGLGSSPTLLVRLGGNERSVQGQYGLLRALGELRDLDENVWMTLRTADAGARGSWRWSQLSSAFGDTWTAADRASRGVHGAFLHGNPARGLVRVIAMSQDAAAAQLARAASAFQGTVAIEKLPREAWPMIAPSLDDPISRGLRAKFDPAGILNPGILPS